MMGTSMTKDSWGSALALDKRCNENEISRARTVGTLRHEHFGAGHPSRVPGKTPLSRRRLGEACVYIAKSRSKSNATETMTIQSIWVGRRVGRMLLMFLHIAHLAGGDALSGLLLCCLRGLARVGCGLGTWVLGCLIGLHCLVLYGFGKGGRGTPLDDRDPGLQ